MTPILDPRFLAVAAVVASTALPAAADAVDGAARGVTKLEVYASADDEQPQRLVDVREVRFPLPVVETDGDFLQVRLGGRLVWLDGRQVRVDKPLEWACVPSAAKPGFVAATQGAAGRCR
ncbi:MAG: hypothetical protein MZW92_24105 [Comamonadaceae bacterium]|nr:hypothetical protein [Comamonadaceae bacterium]